MPEARAVRIAGAGGVEVLKIERLHVREPGFGEVLVKVAAAGVNRADVLQRMGLYPAPPGVPPDVPGLEYVGTIEVLGPGVGGFSVGDRVMGIVSGGAMATYLVAHHRELVPVPAGMGVTDAAAIPEVFMTAYDALCLQAGLRPGQVVLLHAVGSGVGTAALQLTKISGGVCIGTSRSTQKLERCLELGLDHAILAQDKRFLERLEALPGSPLADVILDTVGAAYMEQNVRALAIGGHLVIVGLMGGATAELSLALLLQRRAKVTGSVLRSRPLEEKASLAQAFIAEVLPLLHSGRVKPVVDQIMPMEQIAEAHRRLESNQTFGKIVMCWE